VAAAIKLMCIIDNMVNWSLVQAEQERLRETLKAQEEAIREAITKEKKDKESIKERLVFQSLLAVYI